MQDKGLEIHAAIEQKDVKPMFPVVEQWKQLQEKSVGLLEDMSNDDAKLLLFCEMDFQ